MVAAAALLLSPLAAMRSDGPIANLIHTTVVDGTLVFKGGDEL